jgi:hypothetical protein
LKLTILMRGFFFNTRKMGIELTGDRTESEEVVGDSEDEEESSSEEVEDTDTDGEADGEGSGEDESFSEVEGEGDREGYKGDGEKV